MLVSYTSTSFIYSDDHQNKVYSYLHVLWESISHKQKWLSRHPRFEWRRRQCRRECSIWNLLGGVDVMIFLGEFRSYLIEASHHNFHNDNDFTWFPKLRLMQLAQYTSFLHALNLVGRQREGAQFFLGCEIGPKNGKQLHTLTTMLIVL